jgi:hypothetical protein
MLFFFSPGRHKKIKLLLIFICLKTDSKNSRIFVINIDVK